MPGILICFKKRIKLKLLFIFNPKIRSETRDDKLLTVEEQKQLMEEIRRMVFVAAVWFIEGTTARIHSLAKNINWANDGRNPLENFQRAG